MKHHNKELEAIVSNVTRQTLTELSISQKERNVSDVERFYRKGRGGFNGIRTLVVLTAENPDSVRQPRQFNKKSNRSLLRIIKDNGYAYVPARGVFGGNTENPYAVFNMSVETAKHLCGKFQQTSFVFSELLTNGIVHSEYWEKEDINSPYDNKVNDYITQ